MEENVKYIQFSLFTNYIYKHTIHCQYSQALFRKYMYQYIYYMYVYVHIHTMDFIRYYIMNTCIKRCDIRNNHNS